MPNVARGSPIMHNFEDNSGYPPLTRTSRAWWLLPIFLHLLGGIIGYYSLRRKDCRKARRILVLGFVFSGLGVLLLYPVLAQIDNILPRIVKLSTPEVHVVTKTDGGSLYLALDTMHAGENRTVTFLDPATNRTVPTVDYDIVVKTANTTNIVYKASQQSGQTDKPLRSVDGFVSIPTELFSSGMYEIIVYVYAINGVPLKPVDGGGFWWGYSGK